MVSLYQKSTFGPQKFIVYLERFIIIVQFLFSKYSILFHFQGDDHKIVPLEICLLRKVFDVPGVVRLLDFYEMPDAYVLILERPVGCKDLFDFINDHGFLEESLARDFLRQVVDAILACHQRGVIHRDIKDENLLVTWSATDTSSSTTTSNVPRVQLLDFGSGAHIRNHIYFEFDGEFLYVKLLMYDLFLI